MIWQYTDNFSCEARQRTLIYLRGSNGITICLHQRVWLIQGWIQWTANLPGNYSKSINIILKIYEPTNEQVWISSRNVFSYVLCMCIFDNCGSLYLLPDPGNNLNRLNAKFYKNLTFGLLHPFLMLCLSSASKLQALGFFVPGLLIWHSSWVLIA